MKIELKGVGKRFRHEWILSDLNLLFHPGQQYAISGPNGSGKSTLLKMVSGHLTPTKGKIFYSNDASQSIKVEDVYKNLSYAAPYIELIEEFTLSEALKFHQQFKPWLPGIDLAAITDIIALPQSRSKALRFFSSGMKQRLKIALALCSATTIVLLDEPTTNLDQKGIDWYRALIDEYAQNRLLIIASNVEVDFDFCKERISVLDYKKKKKRKLNL